MVTYYSNECWDVLSLLKRGKNVLLSGAPGTGKSRLLNEVAEAFITYQASISGIPIHDPTAAVPIPATTSDPHDHRGIYPAIGRTQRQVFRTTFHQNTKYRDFITGIVPKIGNKGAGSYEITRGILYRASEFAKGENHAALLMIDEINRGPAVEVFGGSIVAIEPDKRLDEKGTAHRNTQFFELLDPSSGETIEYAFPEHLYILAAMNQADVSIAPLDVAFLRRWKPFALHPSPEILYDNFGIDPSLSIPDKPSSPKDILLAAIKAWSMVNFRISIGRGVEYQLGHGIFLSSERNTFSSVEDALQYTAGIWEGIMAHVEELFFGDVISVGEVINAQDAMNPYRIKEVFFALESRNILKKPVISSNNIYNIFCSVAKESQHETY